MSALTLLSPEPKSVCILRWLQGSYSLEFLKKSWNLPNNFPDLEKVWKTEIKSGKNGKKHRVFFFSKLQQKCLRDFFSSSWSNHMFAAHYEKSFDPAFFKVSIDHLFDNREPGKKLLSGKSLEFWIQRSVRTLWLLIVKNCFKEQIYGPDYYVKRLLFNSVLIYYNAFFT